MSSEQDSSELQKAFDAFTKYGCKSEGKLSEEGIKQWLHKAGIIGKKDSQISKKDAEKNLPESAKDSGMDFKEFQQYIQDIAKEKEIDANDLMSKLSSAIPTKLDEKLGEINSKLSGK